ncbi:hypothetical protein CROQUDRAFT_661867, partial [Cronartium quercuum f. sp. fusiforme G11]
MRKGKPSALLHIPLYIFIVKSVFVAQTEVLKVVKQQAPRYQERAILPSLPSNFILVFGYSVG